GVTEGAGWLPLLFGGGSWYLQIPQLPTTRAWDILEASETTKTQKGEYYTMANLIYTANSTAQTVPVGGTANLGSIKRRTGCALSMSGDTITMHKSGYYDVYAGITTTPNAAGTVTATLYQDGVPVPGATASATVAATDTAVSLAFTAVVRLCGECCTSNLTVV